MLARISYLAVGPFGLRRFGPTLLRIADELTDPEDPRFIGWPIPDRNPSLEAADISILVLEQRKIVRTYAHLKKWLGAAAAASHQYRNNWGFSPVLA